MAVVTTVIYIYTFTSVCHVYIICVTIINVKNRVTNNANLKLCTKEAFCAKKKKNSWQPFFFLRRVRDRCDATCAKRCWFALEMDWLYIWMATGFCAEKSISGQDIMITFMSLLQKFWRWNHESVSSIASDRRRRLRSGRTGTTCTRARASCWCRSPVVCLLYWRTWWSRTILPSVLRQAGARNRFFSPSFQPVLAC